MATYFEKVEGGYKLDIHALCGDAKGGAACKIVADYVHGEMGLPATDTSTKIFYGDTGQWNPPGSMVWNDQRKDWNGGFRTKLPSALSGKTAEDVKAGLKAAKEPADPNAPVDPNAPKKTRAPRGSKTPVITHIGVKLDMEPGVITLGLEHGEAVYSFSENRFLAIDLDALKYYSNALHQFASEPRSFVNTSVELDAQGQVIRNAWVFGAYTSLKATSDEAKQDILGQAVAKMDLPVLQQAVTMEPVRQGEGVKERFMERWTPKPVVAEVVITPPSEEPVTKEAEVAAFVEGKIEHAATLHINPAAEIPVTVEPEMADVEAAPAAAPAAAPVSKVRKASLK